MRGKGKPFVKGDKRAGRKAGSVNRATADVRAAIAMLANNLGPELEGWLRRGAKKDPIRAAQVAAQLFEYHIPRLARTELSGQNGAPLNFTLSLPPKAE